MAGSPGWVKMGLTGDVTQHRGPIRKPAPEETPDAEPPERMSRVDTAWLRMDNDVNLMMIVGVWLLTPPVTLQAALRERIADKLLKYDRFRQKVVQDADGRQLGRGRALRHRAPRGAESSEPARADRAPGAAALCGELAMTPLDPRHPLWQFHLVEDYDGGSAIIARIHHCIGDGIALISVMMSITDGGSDPPRRKKRDSPTRRRGDWLSDAVLKPLTDSPSRPSACTAAAWPSRWTCWRIRAAAARLAGHGAHGLLQVVSDVAALALMPDDSPTLLKGKPIGRKVVAWSEPMPLDDVKAVGKGLGCSVNDVLLACVAGAIGGYLRDQGDDPAGKEIRAMVPVNLRPLEEGLAAGQPLRPGAAGAAHRHRQPGRARVRRAPRMNELKGSYQPLLAFAVLSVTGLFIKPVQDAILGLFAKKTTAVMTNVPGPAQPLKLLRQHAAAEHVLGARLGRRRRGRVHPQLRRRRAVRADHRRAAVPRPAADHRPLRPEFEKLLLADADAALGWTWPCRA
jgi:diacylglycerol O-acyltransferase